MSVFHADEGQGAPVVFLHGLMASHRVFDAAVADLSKDHRCLRFDLPRSGKSGAWAPMNPDAVADALKMWLEKAGVRKFTLVGHSFGGVIGLAYALRAPQSIDRLVLMSCPGLGLPLEAGPLLRNPIADFGAQALGRFAMPKPALAAYLRWLAPTAGVMTEERVGHYHQALSADGAWAGMLEATRAIAAWKATYVTLRGAFPIEVIWGEKDPLVPLIQGERLAMALHAGFTVLPKLGHCVPEESPETLIAAVRGMLKSRRADDRTHGD